MPNTYKYLNSYQHVLKLKFAPFYCLAACIAKMHGQYTAKALKMLGAISIATD